MCTEGTASLLNNMSANATVTLQVRFACVQELQLQSFEPIGRTFAKTVLSSNVKQYSWWRQ